MLLLLTRARYITKAQTLPICSCNFQSKHKTNIFFNQYPFDFRSQTTTDITSDISPKPPTDIDNTPLTLRQRRYRSQPVQLCDVCGTSFRTRQHLQRHVLEKHEDDLSPYKFPYPCQQCDKRFKRREHLQLHQRTKHSSIKDYKCKSCGKEFVRKSQLTRHMLHHERKKTTLICTGCGRVFARRGNLVNHAANGCVSTRAPGAW